MQSRYYDPATGRFVNADNMFDINAAALQSNLFQYCGNNPVNYIDPTGYWPQSYQTNSIVYNMIKMFYLVYSCRIGNSISKTNLIGFGTYKEMGKAVDSINKLSDVEMVARTIFAEIVPENNSINEKAAYAVAQVVKNRMSGGKSAKNVVTAKSQFNACSVKNAQFANPSRTSYKDRFTLWSVCCFLAYDLVKNTRTVYSKEVGDRKNFYGTNAGVPFYVYNSSTKKYVKCTKDNITKATHYSSKYYPIKKSVMMIGTTAFYSY